MSEREIPATPEAQNELTREVWDRNAEFWDSQMGDEGNEYFRVLTAPAVAELLDDVDGKRVLEIACGNGNFARRLADAGASVLATDFAPNMVEVARARSASYEGRIEYRVVDATKAAEFEGLVGPFDGLVCLMGLMDMASLDAVARASKTVLKPGARFVFALTHPCFNHGLSSLQAERTVDDEGRSRVEHSLRLRGYKPLNVTRGEALLGQPLPQLYFDRSLQAVLGTFLEAGWVLDGLREPAFPIGGAEEIGDRPSWRNLNGIPPVLVCRLRVSA